MIARYIKKNSQNTFNVGVGNLTATATTSTFNATIICKNNEICTISGTQSAKTYDTTMKFSDETVTMKVIQANNSITGFAQGLGALSKGINELTEMCSPVFYDQNNNEIGRVTQQCTKGEGLTQNYIFNDIVFKGMKYHWYKVPLGSNGIHSCIYDENENLIGVISRDALLGKDPRHYDIYAKDDGFEKLLCIIASTWHMVDYELSGNEEGNVASVNLSLSKTLKQKFDPNFINEIIQSENPAYIPENMPTVTETNNVSQKPVGGSAIGLILLFIIIAIVIMAILK